MSIDKKIIGLAVVVAVGGGYMYMNKSTGDAPSQEATYSSGGLAISADHPLHGHIKSGYDYRGAKTQAMQDDDFENPAFLMVDQGEEAWASVEGEADKSCASCHGDDASSVKAVASTYPVFNEASGKLINIEQQINACRTGNMKAEPYKWESPAMLSMTAYLKSQGRGDVVNVKIDGPAAPFFEKGKEFYYARRGQLDMSCAHCHEDNYGNNIRADLLSQGQSNGFPTYRMKWQGVGSLHRRFRGCNKNIRSESLAYGADDYVNLELYLAWRGQGLPIEGPSVRN